MMFKIVAGVSWLVLLVVAIHLTGKLAESRQEIEDLSARLQTVADPDPSAADDLAKAQADLATLKEALSTKNSEIELMQKQSALKREQVVRTAAKERESLTAGIAKAFSRFGLSQNELETLLADLPAEDRPPLLEQITALQAAAPVEAGEPRATGVEANPPPDDQPEEKMLAVPKSKPQGETATEEPMKKDEPKLVTYTVKRGDNLTRIAQRFDVDLARLMKLNGISNANMLRIGQVLKIPSN